MKADPDPTHLPSQLSESLFRRLDHYALTSTAAGVSLLALAQPAEAKVVYTKTHQVIGCNGIFPLDLNHDGAADILIEEKSGSCTSGATTQVNWLQARPRLGNAVVGTSANRTYCASALRTDAGIGPRRHFIDGNKDGLMIEVFRGETGSTTRGQWRNVVSRYLGLRFKIKGKMHYGWARLNVHNSDVRITTTLTGYAYETVPNKSLPAGQTRVSKPNLRKPSLGDLAIGVGMQP